MNIRQVRACLGLGASLVIAPMAVAAVAVFTACAVSGIVVTAAVVARGT